MSTPPPCCTRSVEPQRNYGRRWALIEVSTSGLNCVFVYVCVCVEKRWALIRIICMPHVVGSNWNHSTVYVLVGVIILYDHVHPVGAFAVKAAIDVRRQRVKLLLMMSS